MIRRRLDQRPWPKRPPRRLTDLTTPEDREVLERAWDYFRVLRRGVELHRGHGCGMDNRGAAEQLDVVINAIEQCMEGYDERVDGPHAGVLDQATKVVC